jgi:hypothetical protein
VCSSDLGCGCPTQIRSTAIQAVTVAVVHHRMERRRRENAGALHYFDVEELLEVDTPILSATFPASAVTDRY